MLSAVSSKKHDVATETTVINKVASDGRDRKPFDLDGLTCPLSKLLFFDPVVADDEETYERSAIGNYINSSRSSSHQLYSPVTKRPMGDTVKSCRNMKKIIEAAINNGDISGEQAKAWKHKQFLQQQMEDWQKEGHAGNGASAAKVAMRYFLGSDNTVMNIHEANKWWKIAADGDDALGMTMHGISLVHNFDCNIRPEGVALLHEASRKGSAHACLFLGRLYAGEQEYNGFCLIQNVPKAIRLIRKGVDTNRCVYLGMSTPDALVNECRALLARLESPPSSNPAIRN